MTNTYPTYEALVRTTVAMLDALPDDYDWNADPHYLTLLTGAVGRLKTATSTRQAAPLVAAVDAFLKKWPSVEERIGGVFSLQQVRTGVGYSGPTIGHEIDVMRAALSNDLALANFDARVAYIQQLCKLTPDEAVSFIYESSRTARETITGLRAEVDALRRAGAGR